jgi:hypothetical protein
MARRLRNYAGVPSLLGEEPLSAELKHQSDYGQKPWKPGEIPSTRNGSRIPVYGELDPKTMPHGETLGIQKPANVGKGYSPIRDVDLEGHETRVKQPGPRHGGKGKV